MCGVSSLWVYGKYNLEFWESYYVENETRGNVKLLFQWWQKNYIRKVKYII